MTLVAFVALAATLQTTPGTPVYHRGPLSSDSIAALTRAALSNPAAGAPWAVLSRLGAPPAPTAPGTARTPTPGALRAEPPETTAGVRLVAAARTFVRAASAIVVTRVVPAVAALRLPPWEIAAPLGLLPLLALLALKRRRRARTMARTTAPRRVTRARSLARGGAPGFEIARRTGLSQDAVAVMLRLRGDLTLPDTSSDFGRIFRMARAASAPAPRGAAIVSR